MSALTEQKEPSMDAKDRSAGYAAGYAMGLAEARAALDRAGEQRMECLRLAAADGGFAEDIVAKAEVYANFVFPDSRDETCAKIVEAIRNV